ncbi:hypothetical protein [Micromonospora coxensis]|uniref:hypothetical protein n=1 Tax=Micromonospora coxensis TaxID=356852 RepID=UPI00343A6BA5
MTVVTWDATADRVARAVAAAEESAHAKAEPPARADRDWLVANAAERYGLGEELAARITGNGPTEIQDQARRLAVERSRLLATEAEAERRNGDD